MKRVRLAVVAIVLAVGAVGCESPAPRSGSYTPQRLRAVTPAEAFAAAEQVLSEDFQIATRDPSLGLLRTAHVESRERSADQPIRGTLGSPKRVRKYSEVRIEPAGDGVNVWCKVVVEENQSDAYRMFHQEHALSDIPSDTPADREGGTTAAQNTVWKVKRRDRAMERQIRRSIRNLLVES